MPDEQNRVQLLSKESKFKNNYLILTKLFLFITFLAIICVVVVFAGVSSLGYSHDWALLGVEGWLITVSILFVIFIILELFFYSHLSSIKDKRVELETPKPEFIDGRRVYVFTNPQDKEGGIFSKTYIKIDEHSVLRLRSLMIPPEDLW